MLDDQPFDLAVIGAGSAGFAAAIRGAELGARVALVGHGTIGGTCVNVGCVPSKTLIRAVEPLHQAAAASRFAGIAACGEVADWAQVIAHKDELVGGMRQAKYADILPAYNTIAYMEGRARLTGGGVRMNGVELRPDKIVITTGASPAFPPIPGIEDVPALTSTTALALERLPESLVVVGGGFLGCELAQMFARAGVTVSLVCRSRLLPETEPEISAALAGYLRDEGMDVREEITYEEIRRTTSGVALTLGHRGSSQVIDAEAVLIATGRRANTRGLELQAAGVSVGKDGGIKVDDRMRTTNPAIYAAGDVTGRHRFVYMAAYGAKLAVENALNGDSRRYDAAAMPAVIFTDPQVAGVGLTEAGARQQGISVKTALLPLAHVPRAVAARDTRGLIKLVADAETDRLLGAHILAPEGGESIQTAALAIKHGMTAAELGETIFPYLTTVEGLKLAAQSFEKDIATLSCCAG